MYSARLETGMKLNRDDLVPTLAAGGSCGTTLAAGDGWGTTLAAGLATAAAPSLDGCVDDGGSRLMQGWPSWADIKLQNEQDAAVGRIRAAVLCPISTSDVERSFSKQMICFDDDAADVASEVQKQDAAKGDSVIEAACGAEAAGPSSCSR